jgi:hypothetical protein
MNDFILYGKKLVKEYYLNNGDFFKIKQLAIVKLDMFANNGLKIKELEEKGFQKLNLKIFLKSKNTFKYQNIIKKTKDFDLDFHKPLTKDSIILIEDESDISLKDDKAADIEMNRTMVKRAQFLECFFTEYTQFLDLINNMKINEIKYVEDNNWKKSIKLNEKLKNEKLNKKSNEKLKLEINLDLEEEFSFI